MDTRLHELVLQQLGFRNVDDLADRWAGHGVGPQEMLNWLAVGVPVDEPHIAAALAAAEWTPSQAAGIVGPSRLTLLQAVRQHPNAAACARDLKGAVG